MRYHNQAKQTTSILAPAATSTTVSVPAKRPQLNASNRHKKQ
jgi:hypothetical protein